ncbi:MAG TPA: thioredoxin family protein [Verrucomicrobiae bacterium]
MNTNPGWGFPPLRSLTETEIQSFLSERPYSVIHLDAAWDGYGKLFAEKLVAASKAMPDVGFATMDSDKEEAFARTIGLTNVPMALYFHGEKLIASIIGHKQDLQENIRRVKAGESIDGGAGR